MTDAKKIALETSLDTRPVKDGFQEIVQAAESTAAGVKNASDRAGKAVDSIGTGADAAAKKIEGAERSIIASIQRRTAAVQAAGQSESKYYEELARQRGVNTDALRPYLQQLDAAKARQDAASASLGNMGLSAKQTAAALRGVPAQFTDIVTSIASGQQPLTVLLQQGGQLKDMFGGAGNAARALGGYVAGLVNPFTIAAGAIGAVAVAAYQGASELQAFNKTLILSGGQAGVSGDQLMAMAAGIDAISGSITQSKAAETLDEIVKAGVRGEAQIKRYALAAAEFEAAGGGAAAEVAKQFAELGKDPLAASVKLTQSMGYLTAETYKQIKALEDQGRSLDAARVAQDAYASALEGKTPALMQNLGLIERGWAAVKNGAKEAWDAMLGVGRADTLAEQIAAVEKRLASARANPLIGSGYGAAQGRKKQEADEALLSLLKEQQRMSGQSADMAATRTASEKARISWMQEGDKYLSKEAQMEREIAKIKAQGLAAGASELEIEKRIAALREKNATKPRTSRTREGDPFAADREAAKGWADYIKRISDIAADAEGKTLGLSKAQQELVQYLQSPAYGQASESMRELALSKTYAAIESERLAEAVKKEQAAIEAAVNAMAGRIEGQQSRAAEIQDQVRQQTEATAAYGLSGDALLQLESARLLDAAAERERQAVIADGVDLSGMLGQAYRDEAQALRDLSAAKQNDAAVRKQKDAYRDLWQGVEGFAENAFMDVAMNGEDAFKRIGKSIQREILQMLYEMTVKKWIFQITGVSSGVGGGGMDWTSLAGKAYDYYASAGSAAAVSAGAGTVNTTTLAGVSAASAGSTGVAGGTAASGSAAGASSASWISAVGYVALIAAAVMVAENLYSKGYNRAALGDGSGENKRFGYTNFTSDPNMGNSWQYNYADPGMSKFRRNVMDAVGMSEKWADIFSGTTRMATLFGRKLGAYGYDAQIAGGDAEVGGFARYKGGLFRSNKTVGIDIDQRDAAAVDAIVESTIEGARGMAKAMGYSSEAIDAYTGSIKVNMKGAETAEEQSKRMAEAMDELQFSLLKAAAGGKYSKEEFEKMMEGVRQSIEAAGISTGGIADILVQGMTGRLSKADVGDQLADMIVGGIYNSIASNYAGVIAQAFTTQIITPIFTALAAGVPISQAISQAAISNVVATAQSAAQALNAIFNDAGFRQAIGGIQQAISGVAGAVTSVKVPKFGSAARAGGGNQASQERYNLETELLNLLGNTNALRRRELASLSAGNRALQQRIWALEDAKDGVNNAMEALERAADARRKVLQDQLDAAAESEQALKDVFDVLRDNLRDIRGEVTPQTSAAQGRALIREALGGEVVKADDLANAINAVREGIDATQYASRVERDRAMLLLAAELDTLAGSTEQGLSAAEQQVTLLEEQLEGIDSQLELAQKQVDALFGVDTSVKTVEQAVQALTVAMAGYSAAVAAAAAVKVSYGAAPGGSSGGGGGFSTGGGSTATGWTAGGYWDKNPDIRDYYTQNADWLSKQFGGRDKYLEWHWQNQGQKERRKFASGAAFTGGVVQRPTLFNIGQMGEAGPEGILPLANIGGRLGVMSSSDQETKKLLREVIERLDSVASNTEAGALHASRAAATLRKASREGGALAVQAAEGAPVKVEVIA